jgi:hypothetical protein
VKIYLSRIHLILIPALIQYLILLFIVNPKQWAIYGSNDDALIASFSVDEVIGTDKDNWVFIKSLISIPATWLQSFFFTQGVFGYVLAFVIIFSTSSLFLVSSAINSRFIKINFLLIVTLATIVFYPFAILNPTYTGAALFSGSVGFGILLFILRSNQKSYFDLLVISGILISFSYLIRTESFLLALGFFGVVALIDIVFYKKFSINLAFLKIPVIIFITVLSSNLILDKINYSSDDWKEYLALNDLRHSIQLRTAEYVLVEHLSEVGWSEYDYSMFRKFSLADSEKLSTTSLEKAIDVTDSTRGLKALASANLKNELIFINYSYNNQHWILLFVVFLGLILISIFFFRNIKLTFYLLFIFLVWLGVNYLFAVSYHLPDRLTFNLIYMLAIALIVVGFSENFDKVKYRKYLKIPNYLLYMLLFFALIQILPDKISQRIEQNIKRAEIYQLQKNYFSTLKNNEIFTGTGSRFIYQGQSPYHRFETPGDLSQTIFTGWHNLSPIWDTQVTDRGIDPNKFHQEFLRNENLYWIDDVGALEGLQGFYQQYSQNSVVIEDQGFLGTDFYRVYKVTEIK